MFVDSKPMIFGVVVGLALNLVANSVGVFAATGLVLYLGVIGVNGSMSGSSPEGGTLRWIIPRLLA